MESESGPQFELPPQQAPEQASESEQVIERQRPARQEAGVGKKAPQPGSTATPDDAVAPVITDFSDEPTKPIKPVSPATSDLTAADADLIEKQWIDRAKTVAAKTRDDPHLQKSEMSKVKADYIQKRFHKTIKTDDSST